MLLELEFDLQTWNGGNDIAADEGQSSWLIYEKKFSVTLFV